MLKRLKEMVGFSVHASDGEIGIANDFFFREGLWAVRYVMVRSGEWLSGKKVLLSFDAFSEPDWENRVFRLNVTRDMVKHSPDLAQLPIPAHYESELAKYYSWPVRQEKTNSFVTYSELASKELRNAVLEDAVETGELESIMQVAGYDAAAIDGKVGTVEDFLVDIAFWNIRYIMVNTGDQAGGKRLLLDPQWVDEFAPERSEMRLNMMKETILKDNIFDVRDLSRIGRQSQTRPGRPAKEKD